MACLCAGLSLAAAPATRFPAWRATTIDGANLDLSAADRKVVVVNYWATWCAPCRVEMPMLDAAYARFHGEAVEMIGIALDSGASRDKNQTRRPGQLPAGAAGRHVDQAIASARRASRNAHLRP
ncbi:TlpA disulfide reductase family protein [Novosphingobium colocasiae]